MAEKYQGAFYTRTAHLVGAWYTEGKTLPMDDGCEEYDAEALYQDAQGQWIFVSTEATIGSHHSRVLLFSPEEAKAWLEIYGVPPVLETYFPSTKPLPKTAKRKKS